jgi:hypothetical protein
MAALEPMLSSNHQDCERSPCYLTSHDIIRTTSAWYSVTPRISIPNIGALLSIQAPALLGDYAVYHNGAKIGHCEREDYGRYKMQKSRLYDPAIDRYRSLTSLSKDYPCIRNLDYVSYPGVLEIEFRSINIKDAHGLHHLIDALDSHTRISNRTLEALIILQHRNTVNYCRVIEHAGQFCHGGRLSISPTDGSGGHQ